jgi:hypothetical protein
MFLILWVFRNMWARAALLIFLGSFAWLGGMGSAEEAQKYKKGPQVIDVQDLGTRFRKYDYFKTKGFSDGYYVYLEITKTRNGIETGKNYILYYPLMNKEEFAKLVDGKSINEVHPSIIVRQVLNDGACIKTQDGCLKIGTREITGRAMTAFEDKDDLEAFQKLQKEYQMDNKTLVFDTDWTPATASDASFAQTLGKILLAIGLISIPVSLSLRRRNQAQPVATAQG